MGLMPKPGFVVLTLSEDVDAKLERLRKKTNMKSKQAVIKELVEGALN